jgi:hypothetical protein
VHPKFAYPAKKRHRLHARPRLDPEKFTVFVNAGWIGGGNIPQIFREARAWRAGRAGDFPRGKNEDLRVLLSRLRSKHRFRSR